MHRYARSAAHLSGSPGCNIGRTFRAQFRWFVTKMRTSTSKTRKTHRNPVALALEWRKALDSGRYSSQADIARKKGVSRARVTQILNLLRLAPKVIGIVMDLGDPLPLPVVTERQLRQCIDLPAGKQVKEIINLLDGNQTGGRLISQS